ncbi:macrocin O-methyltransferase [Aliarcobacter butzleri]|jgi:hypothetical protein|uniref:TylF/MycF/NovP-related O-methyltransferase n=1 Tax=Aliarcobacter butzleri TaxID=28197 RepID=UPI001260D9C9|nr:TylF/MycF/NovP-related O-methyltransferase [Aliarcobacter butzleri]MDN5126552.1 macrocin O-methyltransferase [Aliarcobacter butzleri]
MPYNQSAFTYSNNESINNRDELYSLLYSYEAPKDEKERSLALFLRGSQLARILAVQEVYLRILNIPGAIMDFGTWRGTTTVLCENYRAIYETLNFQRYIYAFDTFTGYTGFKDGEAKTNELSNGKYSVEDSYDITLDYILKLHEKNNAMGHINGKHTILKGDVRDSLPDLLDKNKGLSISLAFLDISSYEPTKIILENILQRLITGGVIAMWQFGRKEIEAEGKVFFELLNDKIKYSIHTCKTYPSLVYIVKEN